MILPLVALGDTCLNVKSDNVEDCCVQSATRFLYVQNKLLGIRVAVITLFEFILLFVERREIKGVKMKDIQVCVKENVVFDYILGIRGSKKLCKYNVWK